MILFRHARANSPFIWSSGGQPAGRWHAEGEGPVHYLADSPDGAWAEFLRHEHITDPAELAGIRRAMWAIDVPDQPRARPKLSARAMTGGVESYAACRREARRLRASGVAGFVAPSAALRPEGARAWRVARDELVPGRPRDGRIVVLFGERSDLEAWAVVAEGSPPDWVLDRVRPLTSP